MSTLLQQIDEILDRKPEDVLPEIDRILDRSSFEEAQRQTHWKPFRQRRPEKWLEYGQRRHTERQEYLADPPPSYKAAKWLETPIGAGLERTTPVLAQKIATGEQLTEPELDLLQGAVSEVVSLAADPVMFLFGGLGGVVGKRVGAKAAGKISQKLLARSAAGATTFGAMTATKDPMLTYAATREYGLADLARTVGRTAESATLGAVVGPAGAIPKVGYPAEIGVFAEASALMRGELFPSREDWAHSAALITGLKVTGILGRALFKAAQEDPSLTQAELKALGKVAPSQRVEIAKAAQARAVGRFDLAVRTAESKPELAAKVAAVKEPSRKDVGELVPGAERWSREERALLARMLREKRDAAQIREDEGQVQEARDVVEGREAEGREDIQRYEEGRREGRQPEVPEVGRSPAEALGMVSIDDTVGAMRRGWKASRAFAKRFLTSRGDLPKEAFEEKIAADGWINSQMKQVGYTLKDFDIAAREVYGGRRKMTRQDESLVGAALKGEDPTHLLAEPVREIVGRMRDEIDALSRRMIELGMVEGPLEAIFEKNLGFYVRRSYRVFDDPQWSKKVDPEIRNIAKALLRTEYPDYTEAEIHGKIENLLYEGKAAESPIALILKGRLGQKDLSILTRRKDIPPEIRALWGEYEDARVNYARSVASMAHLIGNQQFLSNVRNAGLGRFLFERPIINEQGEFKTRIVAEPNSRMRPLDGLYTTPEIKAAFERTIESQQYGALFRHYMKVNAITKFQKTVGSWMTHVRNLFAGFPLVLAQGHWKVWQLGTPLKAIAASTGFSKSPEWRAYVREAIEYGVLYESVRAGELGDVLHDATKQTYDQFMDHWAKRAAGRTFKTAVAGYRAEDDLPKIFAWEGEKARYRKAYPEASEPEIKQRTAWIVRNTMPTYSLVAELVKLLRRFPLTGPFVSFPAEIARIGYNTISLAKTELADPRTRSIGMQRLVGALVLAGASTAGIAATSRFLTGISRQHDADKRLFMAPWSQNSEIVHMGTTPEGNNRFIDLSYSDPYEYLKTPIIAFMRGEDWEGKLLDAIKEGTAPFLSEEILAGKLLDIARNTKKSGGPVYNPQDTLDKQAEDKVAHLADALEPGTLTSFRRIYRGFKGYVSPTFGKAYNPKIEAVAMFLGVRIQELDVSQSLKFKASNFQTDLSKANRILTKVANRSGTVTDEEVGEAYEDMERSRRRLFAEMYELTQAATRLGLTRQEVFRVLRKAGVGAANARRALNGSYLAKPKPKRLRP